VVWCVKGREKGREEEERGQEMRLFTALYVPVKDQIENGRTGHDSAGQDRTNSTVQHRTGHKAVGKLTACPKFQVEVYSSVDASVGKG
jgi:hypothetical protein